MEQLLEVREQIKYVLGKNGKIITIGIKFILSLTMYLWIFGFSMYNDVFARIFEGSTQFIYLIILCLLGVVLPLPYILSLFAVNIFMQLSTYLFFSSFLFLILLGVILLYARVAVEESVLILITASGLMLNIPFVAPILAGLYFGATAFIPLVFGSMIYSFIGCFQQYLSIIETNEEVQGIGIDQFLYTYQFISNYFFENSEFLSNVIILVGAFIIVKIIQRLNVKYYKYVSIACSFIYYTIAFFITKIIFGFEYSFFAFTIGLILSFVVICSIVFFDTILDYKSTKYVKFEDRENMYFVKVVPKLYKKNEQ